MSDVASPPPSADPRYDETKPTNQNSSPPGTPPPDGSDDLVATPMFMDSLKQAEQLLAYAAQTGKFPLEPPATKETFKNWVIESILNAHVAVERNRLTRDIATTFWAAFAGLSRITRPVTAASLEACRSERIRSLQLGVIFLGVSVILSSIFLFMNNNIATQVSDLINEQNRNALQLWSHLQYYRTTEAPPPISGAAPPAARENKAAATLNQAFIAANQPNAAVVRLTLDELFAEVVGFSRTNSWLLENASRLNTWFIPGFMALDVKPVDFGPGNADGHTHINVPPELQTREQIINESIYQIVIYQLIRNYSQAVYKTNSVLYGALSTYLLPAVYALLGAALFGFRFYAREVRRRAYLPSSANSARYFIAAIAGIVIGLFNSSFANNLAVPPLAVAFLVGYAVEAFFSRLDDMIARFRGSEPNQASQPGRPAGAPGTGTATSAAPLPAE